ncbi:MAG: RagB/SusD family nutrient uptake outer membrane protein [Bacteroidales bacterium]|nr:RagB/SusD family nutrient uptake outer membrane protein [Bacteroidales bacterium]
MKKIGFFCTLVLLISSCSLVEDTSSITSPHSFYKSREQCVSAINGCYIPLKNIYNYKMMLAIEGCSDIAYANSGTQDAQLDISPAKPRFGADVWTQCYQGISRCNTTLAGIGRSPIDESVKKPLAAETKVMRAFYYYVLTSFFGDVPFYREEVSDKEVLERVGRLGRMSAIDTRSALIDELAACLPDMDQVRACDVPDNRSGAAMGYMLIAKMALWNACKDVDANSADWYATALDACKTLERIYGDIATYSLDDIPFRFKNTPESIFEIQHAYVSGGITYTSNVACICMPYPREADTALYSDVEIPELGNEATTWSPMRPNAYFAGNLLPEGSDRRREMSVVTGWNGEKFTDTRPCFGPKFWCFGLKAQNDSNNYKVFRYADVILMMAEIYCAQHNEVESMRYLNMIKNRAGIRTYDVFKSYEKLLDEIIAERARELFGEFQRKFDLVRWGIWYDRTYTFTDSSMIKENIQRCHEYYPIPDKEVVYSGYALDNKAYKEAGL